MIKVILNNSKSQLIGDKLMIREISEATKIRAPNAFWMMQKAGGWWDGFVRYVSEATGFFQTGILHQVLQYLQEQGVEYEIDDRRSPFKDLHEVTKLGDKDFRTYQREAVSALLNNRIQGIRFQRGILHEATNAGKNLIAAGIFMSFSKKRTGIFLTDEKEIFDQAVEELKELMPGEVGYVSSKRTELKRINVCMIQTLGQRCLRDYKLRGWLARQDIIIYDEADKSAHGSNGKRVLGYAMNATIRVALSGTPLMSKDRTRNQNLIAYFGPVVHHTSNKELVDQGFSTRPIIKILMGNEDVRNEEDYDDEYTQGIIENKKRHKKVWRIVRRRLDKRLPCMIMFKYHAHGKEILKACPDDIRTAYKVKMVHHKTSNRREIIQAFKDGKIDILICSMIVRRGKNIPRTKMMINAAGGDSMANVIQLLGRLLRTHESKKSVLLIDFYDWGKYLQSHSKHRIIALKNQKFEVQELYKGKLKTIIIKWKKRKERHGRTW